MSALLAVSIFVHAVLIGPIRNEVRKLCFPGKKGDLDESLLSICSRSIDTRTS